MSTPKKPTSTGQPSEPPILVVPKAWLVALAVLIVMPWLVAGAVYWWLHPAPTAPALAEQRSKPAEAGNRGPWGSLEITSVVVSPPMELIGNEWIRAADEGKRWVFPGVEPARVGEYLASTGLSLAQVAALMATARSEPGVGATVITPSPELLLALSPEVRGRLYVQLAKSELNVSQTHAFRFSGESVEAWLGTSRVSEGTRLLIEPLMYRYGAHVYFADTELVPSLIADPEERRRLAKALLRQNTARVRLLVSDLSEVPALVEYWGRGGRRTDIRPLLESVAGGGRDASVDIVHLLPAFARERLYRYPQLKAEDLNRPALANCMWTALNFFSSTPDDRYLELKAAIDHLQRDYYLIDNDYELGDVVVLLDEAGGLYHAAVYIADGLVFTKNGTSPMAPWVILPLDTVVDYYRLRSENPRLLYHRRKDR